MDLNEARELVVKAGINLVESGLIARTWGNVSCRVDENTFVITPSGRDYKSLRPEEIVEINIKDLSYKGNIKPSSEKRIHAEVYKLHPEMNFVIHTHQENASVIGGSNLDYITVENIHPSIDGKIICAQYGLPGTKSLTNHVVDALKNSTKNTVIMKYHGALCFGENYEETFQLASYLEKACEKVIIDKYYSLSGKSNFDLLEMGLFALGNEKLSTKDSTNINIEKNDLYNYILKNNSNIKHIQFDNSPEILAVCKTEIEVKPLLDDFAQICGINIKKVEYEKDLITKALKKSPVVFIKNVGALYCGNSYDDSQAVKMVTKKACKALIGASLFGKVKPINNIECKLMRFIYLNQYSKKALSR